jgi:phage terminase large subunit
MRDFFEILRNHNIYSEEFHNKSSNEYHLNGNLVEFISLDQPQKIRGRKRNLLFINEANELYYEDWQQLIFRTDGKVIIDYNPSETFHWIYDKVIPRDDCDFYQTTYRDNPFLDETIVSEIERLRDTDEDYWRIYGMGERGTNRAAVFQYQVVDEIPESADLVSTGLDFGFTNDPTSIVRVYRRGEDLYIKELLYKTNLTNTDISECLRGLGFSRQDEIWADSAEPKSIEELHRMGWNVKPTVKGADSVMAGIDVLKRHRIHLLRTDLNIIKEFQNYKWLEDKNGNLLNRPVDAFNHAIDAARYATFNRLSRPNYGRYAIR